VCCNDPVITALEEGYKVYVVTDACGDCSTEAHERAVSRTNSNGRAAQVLTRLSLSAYS
jgi:nicotinamidase-related amidase